VSLVDGQQTLEQANANANKRQDTENQQDRVTSDSRCDITNPANGTCENLTNIANQFSHSQCKALLSSKIVHKGRLSVHGQQTLEQTHANANKRQDTENQQDRVTGHSGCNSANPADGGGKNIANRSNQGFHMSNSFP